VLNKPIDLKIQDVIQNFPAFETSVSVGGPVNTNTVHYLHTLGDMIPESIHVKDDIFWGGDFESIKGIISAGKIQKHELRFFLGYSGWSAGQLEEELDNNAWLVADIQPNLVMRSDQSGFWNEVLKTMNNKYQVWANFPENPGLN
jgi:putative transcriptional regulator